MKVPDPIFKDRLSKISWKKIYDREYGVQYSELAVSILANDKNHFPKTSTDHIVIPAEGRNTAFYIDDLSWIRLVEGLNKKYTTNVKGLEKYETQFINDGRNYLIAAKKIVKLNLKKLNNKQLLSIFRDYKKKQAIYSVFAWSAFILNNYVTDRAVNILESYIKKYKKENEKQEIIDSLLSPDKKAAVLQLQYDVEKLEGKITNQKLENLYERFKWLSCLDIHNKPWSKDEFKDHIKSFTKSKKKDGLSFERVLKQLKPSKKDLEYLYMAKKFVYIKDARDDFRRESVFYSNSLWVELGRRIGIPKEDTSYLQDDEIINFLNGKDKISKERIEQRKKGFVMYIGEDKKLICLSGDQIKPALKMFHLLTDTEVVEDIVGKVASVGHAKGKVSIVFGVKDLDKVRKGDIMIAATTHPDFVPAMRRAAAIVTDEGGITSHAAIVSREFGIPCIVGTKLATKVLNDGDFVEVDATSGIVKKLS